MPPSSQLPPLDAILLPEPAPQERGLWWRAVALVVLVVLLGGVGLGGLVYLAVNPSQQTAFPHESLAEKQTQLRTGFAPDAKVDHPDRRNLERFLARIVTASSKQDQRQFRQLVDFDELQRRVLAHPQMPKLDYSQKSTLRSQLEQENGLGQLNRLRLVSLRVVDTDHVVVCALGERLSRAGDKNLEDPWRLWLTKRGNNWLLADWEQVDCGYSTADRVALFQAAWLDPLYSQYEQSEAHLQQAHTFRTERRPEEAAAQLRLAAGCPLPATIADLQRYWIMLEWSQLRNYPETIAICRQAIPNSPCPGFQHELADIFTTQQKPDEALPAALAYEQMAGFQPQVGRMKARALDGLGRKAEALSVLEQLQRLTPTDTTLIPDLYRLLPAERKADWLAFIAQAPEPIALALAQAEVILRTHDDQATAQKLVDFVASQAPDSPELLQIRAVLLESDGEHEQAAALFRQAAERATEDPARQSRWWRYLTAMQAAGKTLEVLSEHPDPDRAFEMLTGGFFDDEEGVVTVRELRPLLAAQLARKPDDPLANYLAGEFARRAGDLATATKHLQQATAGKQPPAGEGDEEEDDYRRSQAQAVLDHIAVLEGRAVQVLRQADDQAATHQRLAGAALSEKDWPALQQLNDAIRNTPAGQQNAWFLYYEAKLAVQAQKMERAVQQMLLAKMQAEGPKSPNKYYLDYLEAEILCDAYGLLEAYQKHPNQRQAFTRYHYQALHQHDWPTAAALLVAHQQTQADDPQLLLAEVETALRQGKYQEVVRLLDPFPDPARFSGEWQVSQLRLALSDSLAHLQRFEDLAQVVASLKGDDGAKLKLLQHLRQGEAAAANQLLAERAPYQPYLYGSLYATHPVETAKFRQDPRLAEVFQEHGAPLLDEFSGPALVLLGDASADWKIEQLREQFTATIPGTQLGEPRPHASGVSYSLTIPGGEACRFQLTIGSEPYTTAALVNDQIVLPLRLRPLVAAQRSWLALESSTTQPVAALDGPWRLLRQLAAALCQEPTIGMGYREPESYGITFVARDAELAAVLRSGKSLSAALDNQPSAILPFAPQHPDPQSPELKKRLRQFGRQWRNKTAQPPTDLQVTIERGCRHERAWFRVVKVEHAQYAGDQFWCDLIPSPATDDFLPPGRYYFSSGQVEEMRAAE